MHTVYAKKMYCLHSRMSAILYTILILMRLIPIRYYFPIPIYRAVLPPGSYFLYQASIITWSNQTTTNMVCVFRGSFTAVPSPMCKVIQRSNLSYLQEIECIKNICLMFGWISLWVILVSPTWLLAHWSLCVIKHLFLVLARPVFDSSYPCFL